jgi:hypothetical protein
MKKRVCGGVFLAVLLAGGSICFGQSGRATESDLYATEPQPLTVSQCGQCHPGIFRNLKDDGGQHRIRCQECHEQFHAYSPARNNWAEIMPTCGQCHERPHGERLTDCLTCHSNPHTPRRVAMTEALTSTCGECHSQPAGELAGFPSAHTRQGCAACHQAHGRIPSCLECHQPHVARQEVAACQACHPAHKPLQISYNASADSTTCGSCHNGVFGGWQSTASRHGQVGCAECHPRHGFIPECTSCHGQPHDADLLKKFPACLACHIDVHDLPVKR